MELYPAHQSRRILFTLILVWSLLTCVMLNNLTLTHGIFFSPATIKLFKKLPRNETDPIGCIFFSQAPTYWVVNLESADYPEAHHLFKKRFYSIFIYWGFMFLWFFFPTCCNTHKGPFLCIFFFLPFSIQWRELNKPNCGLYVNNLLPWCSVHEHNMQCENTWSVFA